jgi:acyl-CoA reductase-like NAD-dependent aldehyde dehydrogenase
MKKVLGYIESGKEEGATLLCGGGRLQDGKLKDGFFVAPTVFSNVSNDMKIVREEIFGPVISIMPFGGYKQSGWGRFAGKNGIEEFTQVKSIYEDWGGFTEQLKSTLLTH